MKKLLLILLPLFLLTVSCSEKRDIAGPSAQADFDARFANRIPPTLDSIMKYDNINIEEKEALIFLYAYMPLADVLNYGAKFHLENVRATFKAADEMPWGEIVPDREFRHFVLPVRIGNEDLDMARPKLYPELKERINGMTMEMAILEINHWCHEKVSFKPSNARINSPLVTISAARGRSIEESILLVAALRCVGIPARLTYTPKWAHTDDSHCWVEAWCDGRWRFLGGCEPEAVLDYGWFNDSASRGLMILNEVYGKYDGNEEIIETTPMSTIINVTPNYAATSPVTVVVTDEDDNPVEGAEVRFSIYSYAEFYPALSTFTGKDGVAEIHSGIGDIIIWSRKDDKFAVALANHSKVCRMKLSHGPDFTGKKDFDIVPPISVSETPSVNPAAVEENNRRKIKEDSIRLAFASTFYSIDKATELAIEINAYPSKVIPIMTNARGNWATIEAFLLRHKDQSDKAVALLSTLSPKDLNDVTNETLVDHFSTPNIDSELFQEYVLKPSVSTEHLQPYKVYLSTRLSKVCSTPNDLIKWVRDSIKIDSVWNNPNLLISPVGVWKAKKADRNSRDIFFVAAARSLGFPARLNPVTGTVQYFNDDNWVNVKFSAEIQRSTPMGTLRLSYDGDKQLPLPKYTTNFTISKIVKGVPKLLTYPETTDAGFFSTPQEIEAGQYMLVSGERLSNGGVRARAVFFNVGKGENVTIPLTIRRDISHTNVVGSFVSSNAFQRLDNHERTTIDSEVGRGLYLFGIIDPRQEASLNALENLSTAAGKLDATGLKFILLMPTEPAKKFDASAYPNLPKCMILGADPDNYIFHVEFLQNLTPGSHTMPKFIIADTFNRVLWLNQGNYDNIGNQIVNALEGISNE